jgi:hypothetical protein
VCSSDLKDRKEKIYVGFASLREIDVVWRRKE